MAYNEEANIAYAVRSVLSQEGRYARVERGVVVASGCTDRTAARAREAAAGDERVVVLEQPHREGKAAAIGAFLDAVPEASLLVLAGADTRLETGSLDALLAPFADQLVGMSGGICLGILGAIALAIEPELFIADHLAENFQIFYSLSGGEIRQELGAAQFIGTVRYEGAGSPFEGLFLVTG